MNVALFYHSLISDWNHGSAHFLRGLVRELGARGHGVRVFEPAASVDSFVRDHGTGALTAFQAAYPGLTSRRYDAHLDLDEALDDVHLVIVHEWNDPELVARIGAHHACNRYWLLFHDTHHRAVTAEAGLAQFDLVNYDGVLASGRVLCDLYRQRGFRAWTWHEAADVRVFSPQPRVTREGDVVWIGNWGETERTAELGELFVGPVSDLRLDARVYGSGYPDVARAALSAAGIHHGGWLPSFWVPAVFARFATAIHAPGRALPGVPATRMFEALACGIPLISGWWPDDEQLFIAGHDYMVARTGTQMRRNLRAVLHDEALAASLAANGRATILARHTCAHRVDELFAVARELV